jgi:type IV pilus assembly protein PilB
VTARAKKGGARGNPLPEFSRLLPKSREERGRVKVYEADAGSGTLKEAESLSADALAEFNEEFEHAEEQHVFEEDFKDDATALTAPAESAEAEEDVADVDATQETEVPEAAPAEEKSAPPPPTVSVDDVIDRRLAAIEKQKAEARAQREPEPENFEGLSEEEAAGRRLASRYRLDYVDVTSFAPDPEILKAVPVELMFRYNFLPYRRERGRLVLVMADPTDIPVVDELSLLLQTPIQPAVGASSAIQEALKRGQGSQRVLEEASESFKILRGDEHEDEVLSIDKIQSDSSPIVRLVDSTVFDALNRRASDIHIETRDSDVLIKYRIDGVLQPAGKPLAKEHHATIISRIKVMAELDIAEKRVPQDGRFRVKMGGRYVDFRVSIMPSVHGEDAVIRILDKESLSKQFSALSLDVLGFDEKELARFRRFIREPYGMVLVTGPTGSGKTTTLYAALAEIKSDEDKIITIEDPVEYQLKGITQIPVNEKKGLTFARGLRSILRHDPDKIMVGEIRDAETADIAIQSALTGHLVFTTVHANNVIDVLGRFLNMKIEPYNFVSALNCVMAQRLVRVICKHCRRRVKPSKELLLESGLDPAIYGEVPFYEGAGCIECGGTGHKGRMAISELLDLSDHVRELILARRSSAEIRRAARDEGMVFLRESAVNKALAGHTTLQEINKVTFVEVP